MKKPKICADDFEPLLCKKCRTITNHLYLKGKYVCMRCEALNKNE
jgi:hypothetical protein